MRHFRILLCTFSVLIYLNIDAKIVDRKEHWKTDCCVACDEEPGRAVRFL